MIGGRGAEMVQGSDRRWLRWLHRVGYLTTALILVQLIFVAVVAGRGWLRDREMRASLVEESRTHETPLLPTGDRYVRGGAIERLGKMTPLADLHGDGFRFVAMPSFGTTEYGVVLSLPLPDADHATGVLTTFAKSGKGLVQHRTFNIPADEYRKLTSQIDNLTDGWPGNGDDLCLDGTPAAFERVRGTRITSGVGNCSKHYEQLKALVLAPVRRFAPGNDLPTENDWHRFDPEDQPQQQ